MRKQVYGRKFKRDSNERKALFRGLVNSLVIHERIETTEEKAKAIKPFAEKLVTKAKKGGLQAQMLLQPYLSKEAMQKMVNEIAPRFADRSGGYTRIYRIGNRLSDDATMSFIEWVVRPSSIAPVRADHDDEDSDEMENEATIKTAKKANPAKKTAKEVKKTSSVSKAQAKPTKKTTAKAKKEDK